MFIPLKVLLVGLSLSQSKGPYHSRAVVPPSYVRPSHRREGRLLWSAYLLPSRDTYEGPCPKKSSGTHITVVRSVPGYRVQLHTGGTIRFTQQAEPLLILPPLQWPILRRHAS